MTIPDLRQRCGNGVNTSVIPERSLDMHRNPIRSHDRPRYILNTIRADNSRQGNIIDRAGRLTAQDPTLFTGAPRKRNPWVETEWARKKALFKTNWDYPIVPLLPDAKTMRAPKHRGQLPPDRIVAGGMTESGHVHKNFSAGRPSDATLTKSMNSTPHISRVSMATDTNNIIFGHNINTHEIDAKLTSVTPVRITGVCEMDRSMQFQDIIARDSGKKVASLRKLEATVGDELHSQNYQQRSSINDKSKIHTDQSAYMTATPWNVAYATRSDVDEKFKRGIDQSNAVGGLITDITALQLGTRRLPEGTVKFRYTRNKPMAGTRAILWDFGRVNVSDTAVSTRECHSKLSADVAPCPYGGNSMSYPVVVSSRQHDSEHARRLKCRRSAMSNGLINMDTTRDGWY